MQNCAKSIIANIRWDRAAVERIKTVLLWRQSKATLEADKLSRRGCVVFSNYPASTVRLCLIAILNISII